MPTDAVSSLSFHQATELFLREKSTALSPVSLQSYRRELKKATEVFGDLPIQKITTSSLREYFNDLQANGLNRYTGKPLAFRTILQHYTVLHSFFANAFENERLDSNPMTRLKRPKPRKNEIISPACAYSQEQIRQLMSFLNNEPPKWRAIVLFAIDSGARAGEIVALKWSAVDLATGRVTICRSLQYIGGMGVTVSTPKSRKSRDIYLNSPALQVMRDWHREQSAAGDHSEYCFTRDDGSLMPPVCFTIYMRKLGERCGIPHLHPHALRHTMATLSLAYGADIASVSEKLGHSNAAITLAVYCHVNENAQRRANERLAAALYGENKEDGNEEEQSRKT